MSVCKQIMAGTLLSAAVLSVNAQNVAQNVPVGSSIYELVYNPENDAIYVASAGSGANPGGYIYKLGGTGKLSVIDSINTGVNAPFGLGLNFRTQVLYTSNTRSNSVSAIDLKSKKVLAIIKNGKEKSHTREIVVDENANLIYVSDVGKESSIWIIDGKTNTYVSSIENTGATTTGMALDQKNSQIFVTNMGNNEVGVIDLKEKKLAKSFSSGGESPTNLIFDDIARKLYVTNQKSGTVTILDADNGKLVDSIQTGTGAIGIGFYKGKQQLVVANRQTGQTSVVDIKSKKVIKQLETGSFPNSVTINQKGGYAFVTNKAKGGRPQQGQPSPPKDEKGDIVSVIKL